MSRIPQQGIARGITPSDTLREAFRMANLLDSNKKIVPTTMFERALVYVDASKKTNMSVYLNPGGADQHSGGQYYMNAHPRHYYMYYNAGVNIHAVIHHVLHVASYNTKRLRIFWMLSSRRLKMQACSSTKNEHVYPGFVFGVFSILKLTEVKGRFTEQKKKNHRLQRRWLMHTLNLIEWIYRCMDLYVDKT